MLDLRRLRLLHELHHRGTLAAVAEALHYSPSAVSQQLSELEREAGTSLLEKVGRGVRLTDAGLLLAEHAAILLTEVEEAESALARHAGTVEGEVRISCLQTGAVNILPGALARLTELHPKVMVTTTVMETAPALEAVLLGQTDLSIGVEYDHVPEPRIAGTERHELLLERMMIALPRAHRLARGRKPLVLSELRDEIWASGGGGGHGALVQRQCNLIGGFNPDVRHKTGDLLVLLALVAAGQAVTFLPEMLVTRDDVNVVLRPLSEEQPHRSVFVASRSRGSDRPALAAARDAIEESARQLMRRRGGGRSAE